MIDIYHSRRINYKKCVYWVRDESLAIADLNEWVLKEKQAGAFYAREMNFSKQVNAVNNIFMFDKNMLTLVTEDKVDDIARGCIVKYKNELWFVESVQANLHLKETEFSNDNHYTTYIALRK